MLGRSRRQEAPMPFYRDHVYSHLVRVLGNPRPIQEVRQRIVPVAQGRVLEIGVGPGVNFAYYDPARVSLLYALEPNPGMIRLAKRHLRRTQLNVEFLDLPGERIPLGDRAVDTVVSTFTLGTIPDVVSAIRGIRRVLKPGGKLIFFEIGLSPDPRVQRWQQWWEPIHHRVFAGLHLTRDIQALISDSTRSWQKTVVSPCSRLWNRMSYHWCPDWPIALPQAFECST
jgi:ubiquinone/menaquinone biosynthesis C-methylase UbiE